MLHKYGVLSGVIKKGYIRKKLMKKRKDLRKLNEQEKYTLKRTTSLVSSKFGIANAERKKAYMPKPVTLPKLKFLEGKDPDGVDK